MRGTLVAGCSRWWQIRQQEPGWELSVEWIGSAEEANFSVRVDESLMENRYTISSTWLLIDSTPQQIGSCGGPDHWLGRAPGSIGIFSG